MQLSRHSSAVVLAVLALGAGLAAQLVEDAVLEDGGVIVVVVALVVLAVEVPRIVLGHDAGNGIGGS
jgi:hypothetical protein